MPLLTRRTLLQALLAQAIPSGTADAPAVVHRAPRPLAPEAVTHDWTAFLGPSHNAVSTETPLRWFLPPPLVWEWPTGNGYASPAIAGDRLLFIHRLGDEEVVECRHAETGASHWRFRYPTAFEDLYGYNNGPRASPVIDGDRVFTVGAEGKLHCLDLETGEVVWRQDFWVKYGITKEPYGTASTPLVEGDRLVVNVGGPGACVVGLDAATGREAWRAGSWGPSYASAVSATVHGQRRVFVFAGGLSNPPTGGLLSIDPATGAVDFTVSHRSHEYLSASASSPVVFGNRGVISASQRAGGVIVEIRPDFTHRVVWTTEEFGLFFNTPIHRDGYLYGFDGEGQGTRHSPASTSPPERSSGVRPGRGSRRFCSMGARGSWAWAPLGGRCSWSTGGSSASASLVTCSGLISHRRATRRRRARGSLGRGNRGPCRCSAGACSTSGRTRGT